MVVSTLSFKNVCNGTHVIHKPYSYVQSTPRNRLSFIELLDQMYTKISDDQKMSCEEFFQLTTLLCHDFPQTIIAHVFKTLVLRNKTVDSDSVTETWIENNSKANCDATVLQSSVTSKKGVTVEQPTFMQFKIGFRCYFFFMEYFEIILHEIFKDNFTLTMDINSCKLAVLRLIDEINSHVSSTTKRGNNSSDQMIEVHYCIPTKEHTGLVFNRLLKRKTEAQEGISTFQISFSEMVCGFFVYLKDCFTPSTLLPDLNNNILDMIDPKRSPIASFENSEVENRMRKALTKIMVFHDMKQQPAYSLK